MKLGIIARCDNTGLGNQTLELVKMLDPYKVILIDSSSFNTGQKQYPERYDDRYVVVNDGFLPAKKVIEFINDVDIILSCEIFYNNNFVDIARIRKKKTILQYNFEFLEYLTTPDRQLPDAMIAPSKWRLGEVVEKFGARSKVSFLPPPTDFNKFSGVRNNNIKRHNRLLHIAGKAAIHDRNGTQSVIDMLKHSTADYELVIRSQSDIEIQCDDPRLKIEIANNDNYVDMYDGFDAMILPRRYAGLCLPMNESLASGLPVFMTNISPNNKVLPQKWLAESNIVGQFKARTMLDIYNADPAALASIVDWYFIESDMEKEKQDAAYIANSLFSYEALKDKYLELFESLMR